MRINPVSAVFLCLFLSVGLPVQAVTIKGRVVSSEDGSPVPGVSVICEHHENRNSDTPDDFQIKTVTGADGAFEIVPPADNSQYMVVIVSDKGLVVDGRTHVDEDTDFGDVMLQTSSFLSGAVFDPAGEAVSGARVKVRLKFPRVSCTHFIDAAEAVTDKDGSYEIAGLPEGVYGITASAPGCAPEASEVKVSGELNYVEVRLKAGACVTGKITLKDGGGVPGVRVAAEDSRSVSAEDGSFRLDGLKAGRVAIAIQSDEYVMHAGDNLSLECTSGATITKDIEVLKAGKLELVLEPENPDVSIPPRVTASIQPAGLRRHTGTYFRHGKVKDGKTLLSGLAEGSVTVSVNGEGMAAVNLKADIVAGVTCRTNILLKQVFTVAGKVERYDGTVVEGAHVKLDADVAADGAASHGPDSFSGPSSQYDSTDGDGAFSMKDVLPGDYRLAVEAAGLLPHAGDIAVGPESGLGLKIVLEKGLSVAGRVANADGSPADGLLFYADGPKEAEGRTYSRMYGNDENKSREDGSFEVAGLVSGTYDVVFLDERREEIARALKVSAGTEGVVVMLAGKRSISFTVRDDSGSSVASARLVYSRSSGGDYSFRYSGLNDDEDDTLPLTDESGNCTLDLMEGAVYSVTVLKDKFLPGHVKVDLRESAAADVPVPVSIVLKKGALVQGKVSDVDGKPVSGLTVSFGGGSGIDPFASLSAGRREQPETDDNGEFTLDNMPYGIVEISVWRRGDGYPMAAMLGGSKVQVVAGRTNRVDIRLEPMGSIKGTVKDKDGSPVEDAYVTVYNPDKRSANYSSQSDSSGFFEIRDVAAGEYLVMSMTYDEAGRSPGDRMTSRVTVSAGQCAELELKPGGGAGGGVKVDGVITAAGKPVRGGTLHLIKKPDDDSGASGFMNSFSSPGEASIDTEGRFTINQAEPGEYIYMISPVPEKASGVGDEEMMEFFGSRISGYLTVKEGIDKLEIAVPERVLVVKLVDEHGTGIGSAQVSAAPEGYNIMLQQLFARYGRKGEQPGEYRLSAMNEGTYSVFIRSEGSSLVRKGVEIKDGDAAVEIRMGKGFEIKGKVSCRDGALPAGIGVVVFDAASGMPVDFAAAGSGGEYTSSCRLQPGEYIIFAIRDGYSLSSSQFHLAKDQTLDLSIAPAGSLEIQVVEASGKGVKGRSVTVVDADGRKPLRISGRAPDYGYGTWDMPYLEQTDNEGKTVIRGLLPGRYAVEVEGSGGKGTADVKVLEKALIRIEI